MKWLKSIGIVPLGLLTAIVLAVVVFAGVIDLNTGGDDGKAGLCTVSYTMFLDASLGASDSDLNRAVTLVQSMLEELDDKAELYIYCTACVDCRLVVGSSSSALETERELRHALESLALADTACSSDYSTIDIGLPRALNRLRADYPNRYPSDETPDTNIVLIVSTQEERGGQPQTIGSETAESYVRSGMKDSHSWIVAYIDIATVKPEAGRPLEVAIQGSHKAFPEAVR